MQPPIPTIGEVKALLSRYSCLLHTGEIHVLLGATCQKSDIQRVIDQGIADGVLRSGLIADVWTGYQLAEAA